MGKFVWGWILEDCIQVQKKEKRNRSVLQVDVLLYSRRENRKFHVKDARRRQRNVSESVMHQQNHCFAQFRLLNGCFLSVLCSRRCCLSSLHAYLKTEIIFSLWWFLKATSILGQFQNLFEKSLRKRNFPERALDIHSTILIYLQS